MTETDKTPEPAHPHPKPEAEPQPASAPLSPPHEATGAAPIPEARPQDGALSAPEPKPQPGSEPQPEPQPGPQPEPQPEPPPGPAPPQASDPQAQPWSQPEPASDPQAGPQQAPAVDAPASFAPPPPVADAPQGNWVDRFAPPQALPFLRLSRFDRPIGTWLLLLPCWWGALLGALAMPERAGWITVWVLIGCAIGAFLMRGAGCSWNDFNDRDIDARVARTALRPLPAGQVSARHALIWMAAQALVALLVLLTFNRNAILLGVLSLVLVAVYPFAKRFTWWPQLFLGLAFNWGALLAWTAQTGTLGLPAVFLYLAGICWTMFYDTIYAHQDREDDALIGVRSTALLFGKATMVWLRAFLVGTVVLMSLAVIYALAPLADPLQMSLGLAAAWAFGAHMNWQLSNLDIDDPQTCLAAFRSNRDAGLMVALILAVTLLV